MDVQLEVGRGTVLIELEVKHANEISLEERVEGVEDTHRHIFHSEIPYSFLRKGLDIEQAQIEHEISLGQNQGISDSIDLIIVQLDLV